MYVSNTVILIVCSASKVNWFGHEKDCKLVCTDYVSLTDRRGPLFVFFLLACFIRLVFRKRQALAVRNGNAETIFHFVSLVSATATTAAGNQWRLCMYRSSTRPVRPYRKQTSTNSFDDSFAILSR